MPTFLLRPFRPRDEESLRRSIDDPEIAARSLRIPHPYSLEHAHDWVVRQAGNPRCLVIDIEGAVAGSVEVVVDREQPHKGEIGYWLARQYWGMGIMTAAVEQVVEAAFTEWGLRRLWASVYPENKASIRVLEKCGFVLEGRLRDSVLRQGKLADELVYGLTSRAR